MGNHGKWARPPEPAAQLSLGYANPFLQVFQRDHSELANSPDRLATLLNSTVQRSGKFHPDGPVSMPDVPATEMLGHF